MNIIIADDHSLILEGFSKFIKSKRPSYQVSAVDNKQELFEQLRSQKVDILFQDIKFRNDDAREFVKEIKTSFPDVKIIIISTLTDEFTVNTLFNQGVDGFVAKSDDSTEILAAIDSVSAGKTFLSADIKQFANKHSIKKQTNIVLTAREREVLYTIINGKTIKEAATALFLSEKTIESYRSNLFHKFDVNNVASLVKKAILEGYL